MLVKDELAASLDALLAERVTDAVARERSAFDAIAGNASGLVLVGMGGLGRRVLRALHAAGTYMTPGGLRAVL